MKYIIVALAVLVAFTSAMKLKSKTGTCPPAPFTNDVCFNESWGGAVNFIDYFEECAGWGQSYSACVACCSEPFCNSDELDGVGACPADTQADCVPQGYAPCAEFCYFAPTCL